MRLKALLIMIMTAAGLAVAGPASAANSAYCDKLPNPGSVHAFAPYASTGYGPVTYGIQVLNNGDAWGGFYSGITGKFSSNTELFKLTDLRAWVGSSNSADNGGTYLTCAWGALDTPNGPIGFGSQYRDVSNGTVVSQVRWGSYNFKTKLFHPDGGDWKPIVA